MLASKSMHQRQFPILLINILKMIKYMNSLRKNPNEKGFRGKLISKFTN